MKKWQIPFLLLLIAGTAFIIRRHNAPSVVPFQAEEGYIFGTIYHAKYQYATSLHEEILQELNTVDASLSMFKPQSCISRINRGEDIPAHSLITTIRHPPSARPPTEPSTSPSHRSSTPGASASSTMPCPTRQPSIPFAPSSAGSE